jgi:hypothetical protein
MPSGVPGDFDVFTGSEAEFQALLIPQPTSAVASAGIEQALDATDPRDDEPPTPVS